MSAPAPIPAVFIHGLWMHASSWDIWVQLFDDAGYHAVAPAWPGDSDALDSHVSLVSQPTAVASVIVAAAAGS